MGPVRWHRLCTDRSGCSAAIASGFLGLVNGLLAVEPAPDDRGAVESAALCAMQDYLRTNVRRPDLDVADLYPEFHCSRATLYRLFQPYGGVKAYQRGLRLEGAFRDLALGRGNSRGRVCAIAERWGFNNLSHFHRSFKRRFDLSPSDVLTPPVEPGGPLKPDTKATYWDDVTRLRGWLERY